MAPFQPAQKEFLVGSGMLGTLSIKGFDIDGASETSIQIYLNETLISEVVRAKPDGYNGTYYYSGEVITWDLSHIIFNDGDLVAVRSTNSDNIGVPHLSYQRRVLPHGRLADLNNDGVVDTQDLQTLLQEMTIQQ